MIDSGYGRIVNIASIAGKEGNPNAVSLFGGQIRRDRADQVDRQRSRHQGRDRQRDHPGRDRDRDPQAGQRRTHQLHDQPHPDGSRWPTARGRRARRIPLLRTEVTFSTGAVFDLSGGRATY